MKKINKTILPFILLSTTLYGCLVDDYSIKKDAKRVADLTCKAEELSFRFERGDFSTFFELQSILEESVKLSSEIEQKYYSESGRNNYRKFKEAVNRELENCPYYKD